MKNFIMSAVFLTSIVVGSIYLLNNFPDLSEAIFGLLGVIVGSFITWQQTYYFNEKSRNERAQYLAVRVALVLDQYSEDCQLVIDDDGYLKGALPKSGYTEPQSRIPNAPEYPEDIDWKSISPKMMKELLLTFPTEIRLANERLNYKFDEVQNTPDVSEMIPLQKEEYLKLKQRAEGLSRKLKGDNWLKEILCCKRKK